jgi:hypothetical protein
MPNIKGISNKNGDISITTLTNTKHDLLRTDLAKLNVDINTGASIKTNTGFDVYTHLYIDNKMKNPNRTVVMVCQKGYIPRKEWWIHKDTIVSEVVKIG